MNTLAYQLLQTSERCATSNEEATIVQLPDQSKFLMFV